MWIASHEQGKASIHEPRLQELPAQQAQALDSFFRGHDYKKALVQEQRLTTATLATNNIQSFHKFIIAKPHSRMRT